MNLAVTAPCFLFHHYFWQIPWSVEKNTQTNHLAICNILEQYRTIGESNPAGDCHFYPMKFHRRMSCENKSTHLIRSQQVNLLHQYKVSNNYVLYLSCIWLLSIYSIYIYRNTYISLSILSHLMFFLNALFCWHWPRGYPWPGPPPRHCA